MIRKSTIDFILENVPIDQVIGEYVSLKKRGIIFSDYVLFIMKKPPLLVFLQIKVFINVSVVVRVAM